MVKLGPVLKFLGCQDNVWQVSVMVMADINDAVPSLTMANQPPSVAIKLCDLNYTKISAWRWEYKIPLKTVRRILITSLMA